MNTMILWRMPSSGMLRHVALVRTDVSEELSASIVRATRIGELRTTLAVTNNWCMLRINSMWEWKCQCGISQKTAFSPPWKPQNLYNDTRTQVFSMLTWKSGTVQPSLPVLFRSNTHAYHSKIQLKVILQPHLSFTRRHAKGVLAKFLYELLVFLY
jgi:hypothetical protein